uniref:Uncharacterized protein n=1 Tax=Anopheles christyi TaxID=43041 RepID=A0A182KCJ7_9DIPT
MSIMCTLVSVTLASTLLLASIVFIGASDSVNDGRHSLDEHNEKPNEQAGVWELLSAATITQQRPTDRMSSFDRYRPSKMHSYKEEDPLQAENSHVVVQVYSVDSDQESMANDSAGTAIRSLKVENYVTPKEQMDGKPTDRVERKVFPPPVHNMQEKIGQMESSELVEKEDLLSERFFIDEPAAASKVANQAAKNPSKGVRYSSTFGGSATESFELERLPVKQPQSSYANLPPFLDYSEHTSQRMLDEFFALRNQDTLAARRSNYDWDEGQLKSRTLEDIENQQRRLAASRRKASGDYPRDDDMSYDRYADYAQQRAVGYGGQKLGRKQRATPSTNGQTHVLNKVPIVAYDGDGSMAPMYKSDGSQRSQFERSRFHYSLPSMVYNPYAWDPYHMNMLRFPQCSACQQNARALCTTCGRCADCCAHSKCTCGCLNG